MEAVQEIKEVCSERTIALTEQIFTDYQKITELQHKADFRFELLSRESNFRKKRDKCDLCENKVEAYPSCNEGWNKRSYKVNKK